MGKNNENVFGILVLTTLAIIAAVCFQAWILMVLWGAVASIFDFSTISFWESIVVSLFLSFVGMYFKGATR